MNAERLTNAARAVRESPKPDNFTMKYYNVCGSPGCVLGHYAARPDLQSLLTFDKINQLTFVGFEDVDSSAHHSWPDYDHIMVRRHFGITAEQAWELFSANGCGNARSPTEAADYIEAFVRRGGVRP